MIYIIIATGVAVLALVTKNYAALKGKLFRYAQVNTFAWSQNRTGYIPPVCDCSPCGFLHGPEIDATGVGGNNRLGCKCIECDHKKAMVASRKPKEYIYMLNNARAMSTDPNQFYAMGTTVSHVNEHPKCANCHGLQDPNFNLF